MTEVGLSGRVDRRRGSLTFPDEALDPDEAQGAAAKAFRLAGGGGA
jgi:hypothetical protein